MWACILGGARREVAIHGNLVGGGHCGERGIVFERGSGVFWVQIGDGAKQRNTVI